MFDKDHLATLLEITRVKKGLTKRAMAAEMGITETSYIFYAGGNIPDQRIKQICDVTGIEVEDILIEE